MQLITFIDNENNKKTMWGQYTEHKGYMQAIDCAKYLLKNTIEPDTFSVVVSAYDNENNICNTYYSLKSYLNTYEKQG